MMWIVVCIRWFVLFGVMSPLGLAGVPGIKLRTTNIHSDFTDYPEMSAVIGSAVSLPCNLSPPSPDDSISLVLWYRLDVANPIYTLDARTVPADRAKHFSSKVIGSRGYFNVSNRPAVLHLQPVEESDAAEYRCRVDFRRGRTLNRMVKLSVIVPTSSLAIRDRDNKTLSGVIGPYREGASLTLICEAEGGRPPPSVTWWRGTTLLDDSSTVDERGIVRNELILINLERRDLMTVLTCQASNTNLSSPATVSVTIDINLNPKNIQITTTYGPISAGEEVEVSCKSQGSRPPARISWWRSNEDMTHMSTEKVYDDVTTSRLMLVPSSEDNGRYLVCRSENPDLPDSALEDRWLLNVYYPPLLSLALGASQQHEHIREGSDVYFDCNIQANPPVTDVRWKFQSRELLHDPSKGVLVRNHSLLLQNVRRSHRGKYRCLATNLEGEGRSEETVLRVQFAPLCKPNQKVMYGVARHEDANISCEVEADPPDVAFRWAFNNTAETIDIVSYSSGGIRSIARYIPRTKMDYGALYCWGKNSIGMQKDPCIFTIVPTGPPEPVQNCSITNQTSSMLMLACEAGDDGGLQQTFHLEVYSLAAEQLITNVTSMDGPVFVAERLSSGSSFILVLYASNSKGRSTSVALTASTLYSAERRTEDTQPVTISAVLVVLMGIVGALVLLAIIIIFIMKARGEQRGKQEEKKSDEKLPTPVENNFDGKQTDIFNSKNFATEYVDLTPNATTERIYESLGDCKEYTYENVIHKAHFPANQNQHSHLPSIVAR